MRIFILSFVFLSTLYAYTDSDLDGIEDQLDACPNTPILELVDINGCSPKALESDHHYDIIVGGSYSQVDYNTNEKTNTLSTSLQVDYFYKNYSLQASTSHYSAKSDNTRNSGLNDSVIAGYYRFNLSKDFSLRLGVGIILPTYDTDLNNNNTDYLGSLSASYSIDDYTVFGSYNYTIVNDDDVAGEVTYKNSSAYSLGIGNYLTSKHYISTYYYQAESIYEGLEDIKSISIYNFYSIDANWFTTFSYTYGLSDTTSDHFVSLRLGYNF